MFIFLLDVPEIFCTLVYINTVKCSKYINTVKCSKVQSWTDHEDVGARWGWVVNTTSQPLYLQEYPLPIL